MFIEGGWRVTKGVHVGTFNSLVGDVSSHGEGIACYSTDAEARAVMMKALVAAGIDCNGVYQPDYLDRFPADVFIRIGPQ